MKRFFLYGIPKSLLFKIVIALLILLLGKNVFALEVDVTNSITSPNSSSQGKYQGTEIYNTGGDFTYNVNTRYNGRLSRIRFNLPLPDSLGSCFTTNVDYKVTMNMATSDWRNKFGSVTASAYNINYAHYSTVFVSQKKIYFTFKIPSSTTTCIDYVFVDLKSTNVANTAFTGETNWNLQSIKLTDPTISTGGGSGSSPTPTPRPDYSDIINNQNENTNNIINNQNDNTNNIIENNNQNSENIVNSINDGANAINQALSDMCPNLANWDMTNDNKFTLTATSNDTFYESNYKVSLNAGTTYYFSYSRSGGTGTRPYEIILSYNNSYAYYLGGYYTDSFSFTPQQTGDYYLRMDCNNQGDTCSYWNFYVSSVEQPYCPFGSSTSKLDTANSIAQDTNDYLKDDSDPNISDSQINDVFGSVGWQDPLNYLLTLPVKFINQLVSQSNSCQVVNLGSLYGVDIKLPCIDIEDIIGSSVWHTIDILIGISLLINIFRNLYHTWANLTSLGAEKKARETFNFPSPMDFLASIFGGGSE